MTDEQPASQASTQDPARDPRRQHLNLGRTVASSGVAASASHSPELQAFVHESLARHVAGDWGELDDEDREANNSAFINNGRVLSVYDLPASVNAITTWGPATVNELWIITEADRTTTTVLWPCEY